MPADAGAAPLGDNLRAARTDAGLGRTDAARRLGLSRQTIWSHETGETEPTEEMLGRYAALYGVSPARIRYGVTQAEQSQTRTPARGAVVALYEALLQGARAGLSLDALDVVRNVLLTTLRAAGSEDEPVRAARVRAHGEELLRLVLSERADAPIETAVAGLRLAQGGRTRRPARRGARSR